MIRALVFFSGHGDWESVFESRKIEELEMKAGHINSILLQQGLHCEVLYLLFGDALVYT